MTRTTVAAIGLLFLYVVGSTLLARHVMPVHSDEATLALYGSDQWTFFQQRYSAFDDVFDPSLTAIRGAMRVTTTIYNAWVGLWVTCSKTIGAARASSCAAGVLTLLAFYRQGRRWMSPGFGVLLLVLVLFDPIFLLSSCLVRPESLLLLSTVAILGLLFSPSDWRGWKGLAVGLACGLQFGIHANSLPIFFGMAAAALVMMPQHRARLLLQLSLGYTLGVFSVLLTMGLINFYWYQKTIYPLLYRPPLLSGEGSPLAYARHVMDFLLTHTAIYFQPQPASWDLCLWSHQAAILVALLLGKYAKPSERWPRALWAGLAGTLIGMTLLLAKHEALYRLALTPFITPLVGKALWERRAWTRTVIVIPLTLSLAYFALSVKTTFETHRAFAQTLIEVQNHFPNRSFKLLGPNLLWFVWPSETFRDLSALMTSHLYDGGQTNFAPWISSWRPTLLVTERSFEHTFLDDQPSAEMLRKKLHVPVTRLGQIESPTNGPWTFFQIDWPKENQA